MEEIIQILHQGEFTCVVRNKDEIRTFSQRGVADLYDLLNYDSAFLKGALVADKIVGKAAAALMVLGGINKLHTDVISTPALNLLQDTKIKVSFQSEVPIIINRDKTDWCPLEKLCNKESSVSVMLQLITTFINENKKKN